jgi:hypothetical protein
MQIHMYTLVLRFAFYTCVNSIRIALAVVDYKLGFLRLTMGLKFMKVNLHFQVHLMAVWGIPHRLGLEEREKWRPVIFAASRSELESPCFFSNGTMSTIF